LISEEILFTRRAVGYTSLDHKINEEIMKELQISQITGEIGTHSVNVFTG
jgi:hypothetical protein